MFAKKYNSIVVKGTVHHKNKNKLSPLRLEYLKYAECISLFLAPPHKYCHSVITAGDKENFYTLTQRRVGKLYFLLTK